MGCVPGIYLEGYAMRHLNFFYATGSELVIQWKSHYAGRRLTREELPGVFYWFDLGWDQRGFWPWQGLP